MKNDTISKAAAVSEIESIVDTISVCMSLDECKGMRRMKKTVLERINALPPIADANVATSDTISRHGAISLFEKYGAEDDAIMLLNSLPPAPSEYTIATPEEVAAEVACGNINSSIYWGNILMKIEQMGYVICKSKT